MSEQNPKPLNHVDASESGGDNSPPTPPAPSVFKAHAALTQKQRRIGERLIEYGIFAVATVSILAIFLIFIFIFREAAPIFFDGDEPAHGAAPADTAGGNEPLAYNPDAGEIPTPGADTGATNAGRADTAGTNMAEDSTLDDGTIVYNPGTGEIPSADSAGGGATDTDTTGDAAASEKASRDIVGEDYPILEREDPVKPGHLFHDVWEPNSEHPRYGIYPIIIGTLKSTFVALLIAIPLAILAALYTAFFAPRWVREFLKPAIELLAGFPSVVIGFFCLVTVASFVQNVFGVDYRLNAVTGGIGLALAVIPIIFTITDDALRSVPKSLREAALALGSSEWQAAYQVMLPAATPGIFAAVLLGLGRAFGETMIALMAMGNARTMEWDLFLPIRTLAATIGAEMGEVVQGSPHYQVLFLLGVILFIFSFLINLVTEFYIKQKLIKKFRGSE